jgi:hypothetical protein
MIRENTDKMIMEYLDIVIRKNSDHRVKINLYLTPVLINFITLKNSHIFKITLRIKQFTNVNPNQFITQ